MLKTVNGRAVGHYKNFNVRETGLAVPEAEPLYIPGISNGYAPDDYVIDANLVLNLPLYRLKGGAFKSVDRYQHTATVTGATWAPTGHVFDGTDDKIVVPDHAALKLADAISIEVWVKSVDTTGEQILIVKQAAGNWNYNIEYNGSAFLARFYDGAWHQINSATISGATWYHVMFTYDKVTLNLYVDTVAATPVAYTGAMPTGTDDLEIGENAGAGDFEGTIGEVRIYNAALSAAGDTHNYNATRWRYK